MQTPTHHCVLDAGLEGTSAAADREQAACVGEPHDGVLDQHDGERVTRYSLARFRYEF